MVENTNCPICLTALDWDCEETIWNHLFCKHNVNSYEYLCYLCGRKSVNYAAQKVHLKQHEIVDPCKCTLCGKRFKSADKLISHSKHHFEKSLSVDCRLCGSYVSRENFPRHVKAHVRRFQEQQSKSKDKSYKIEVQCPEKNEKLNTLPTLQEKCSAKIHNMDIDIDTKEDLSLTVGQNEKIDDPDILVICDSRNAQYARLPVCQQSCQNLPER